MTRKQLVDIVMGVLLIAGYLYGVQVGKRKPVTFQGTNLHGNPITFGWNPSTKAVVMTETGTNWHSEHILTTRP